MLGIYIQASGGSAILKAPMRKFTGIQMPREMVAVREYHFQTEQFVAEKKEVMVRTKQLGKTAKQTKMRKEEEEMGREKKADGSGGEEGSVPQLNANHEQTVKFMRLVGTKDSSMWDDAGSQTDHSEMSEGHYSDESPGDRQLRERRNDLKKQKRIRRIRAINMRHGIVD
ncbi:unnamed protein product [Caenorhabditis sp. 36 PRJEB53466]|nr:unnamed protein product [Caenorhabditis sp. 36 PRJEB53466]